MSELLDTIAGTGWDHEFQEWRQQQRYDRQERLAPIRNTIMSALFAYPQRLDELRGIVHSVTKLTVGYTTIREEDILNSLLDLTEDTKIQFIHEGSQAGQFELSPSVTSSSWELPPA